MHFKLFEQYVESRVLESGNAFAGTEPIPAEYQRPTFDVIEKEFITKVLGLKKDEYGVLGSTFKKKTGTTSGDIDIAVNGLVFGSNHGLAFGDVVDEVYAMLKKTFPKYEVNLTKGLGVTNIKFPQYDESGKKTDKFAQIDFMVVDDIKLATFIYHSPDFTKEESKYKGVYRTIMIYDIIRHIDFEEKPELYKDEFEGEYEGLVKSFKKYTLTAHDGLKTQTKSFDGKKGRKKNAATVKGADKIITKNIDDIAKFILGPDGTVKDLNSFESIWEYIHSDKFPHKHKLPQIIDSYKKSIINAKFPLPSELDK
jgi:hypothetical protein